LSRSALTQGRGGTPLALMRNVIVIPPSFTEIKKIRRDIDGGARTGQSDLIVRSLPLLLSLSGPPGQVLGGFLGFA
jgi:hypothetical protein